MTRALKLAVLASGRGSNLGALLRAIDAGTCAARVVAVLSDRERAPALALARERAIEAHVVLPRDYPDRAAWDRALAERVAASGPDLIVLAGFMRILGAEMLARFPRHIVNVHPSLLPLFPGIDAPQQALDVGVRVSGCTVHLVDAGVDTGPPLAQAVVPVHPTDDAATLHTRIQRAEHLLLPAAVHAIATGKLVLEPRPTCTADDDHNAYEHLMLVSPPWLLDRVI